MSNLNCASSEKFLLGEFLTTVLKTKEDPCFTKNRAPLSPAFCFYGGHEDAMVMFPNIALETAKSTLSSRLIANDSL